MTIAAYQSLYESSVLFGINKQIQAEEGKSDLEKRIQDLERQKEVLTNRVKFQDNSCLSDRRKLI